MRIRCVAQIQDTAFEQKPSIAGLVNWTLMTYMSPNRTTATSSPCRIKPWLSSSIRHGRLQSSQPPPVAGLNSLGTVAMTTPEISYERLYMSSPASPTSPEVPITFSVSCRCLYRGVSMAKSRSGITSGSKLRIQARHPFLPRCELSLASHLSYPWISWHRNIKSNALNVQANTDGSA
jgi:hypothetical protein